MHEKNHFKMQPKKIKIKEASMMGNAGITFKTDFGLLKDTKMSLHYSLKTELAICSISFWIVEIIS